MTHRLLVNAGTPQAWEIQLRPGPNRLGRGEDNDHQVNHPSVSTHHCEIVVSAAGALLKDLGSTNGTFLNRAPVREALLQSGQHLQLGSVDMVFESAAPANVAASMASPAVRVSASATMRPASLRISAPAPREPEAPAISESEPPLPPPLMQPAGSLAVTDAFCKFHQRTPARFFCQKCDKYFCDLCVTTLASAGGPIKTCRACGARCTPVQVHAQRAGGKGFFARLPGAFIYPFKGGGALILIVATIVFTALNFVSGGIFGIIMQMAVLGYLFCFLQSIVHATASEEEELPGLPGGDGVFGAFFELAGAVTMSFGLAIGLAVAKVFFEVDVPMLALVGAVLFGCLYFPMAFLAVAMKDSVMAANPMVVLPAILKVPLEYIVTVIFLVFVFGLRALGDFTMDLMFSASLTTKSMSVFLGMAAARAFWAFLSLYLLTVMMRVLGLLYVARKHKLGWFSR